MRAQVPPASLFVRTMSGDTVVYVGNLPNNIREREVEDAFYRFGRIRSVDIKTPSHSGTPAFAFVEFNDSQDAEDAVKKMDGKELFGGRIRVRARALCMYHTMCIVLLMCPCMVE